MNQVFKIQGELTRNTYNQVVEQIYSAIATGVDTVDLSAVTRVDSCAVALWVEFTRANVDFEWVNLPAQMQTIANLVGVDIGRHPQ
jgi:ABC-type transporter Mla MlaB component